MSEEESGETIPPSTVGGAISFSGKPRKLVIALKREGGLLVWPDMPDRAARRWVEVPPLPELEKELRAAHDRAMAEAKKRAPQGAVLEPRLARLFGLPKVEFGPEGKVRADVSWGGKPHTDLPRTPLSAPACAAVWKLFDKPLALAEIPHPLPATFPVPGSFETEDQLEKHMVSNWDKLPFSTDLELMDPQYPTDVGRIDMMCRNRNKTGYTVIELKRGRTGDAVVGQVQRYKDWANRELANGPDQSVWGIIICHEADPKLIASVRATPNLDLYTYVRQEDGSVVFTRLPKKN